MCIASRMENLYRWWIYIYVGQSGEVFKAYLKTARGKELVAVKTVKGIILDKIDNEPLMMHNILFLSTFFQVGHTTAGKGGVYHVVTGAH